MLLLHLYTKGKGNTSIGIVKRILSKDYEDAGYPPPTNVKKQKITQKMGDSEEKNLFAIDKKCREELYNDIPNVLKHVSKANSIDETHSISSDNNSKTMKFHITEPSIDTNLTAESRSFPVILANMAQFVSFLYTYFFYCWDATANFLQLKVLLRAGIHHSWLYIRKQILLIIF